MKQHMLHRALSLVCATAIAASLLVVPAMAAGTSTQTGSGSQFTDVPQNAYYASPVSWAVQQAITAGTTATTFAPNQTCTRAQIITFLWRWSGSPKPMNSTNPFTDVQPGVYYYDACCWAAEMGMVSGSTFAPNDPCTRAMAVEFMWRKSGSPKAENAANFTDVPASASYADAVSWALQKGVTSGTTATTFAPSQTCTRAQIVTFLYRDANSSTADTKTDTGTATTPSQNADTAEAVLNALPDVAQEYLRNQGMTVLTTPNSVNAISDVGKKHPTVGYTEAANKNGYHTEATVDVSGAVLDYDAVDMLNVYRKAKYDWIYEGKTIPEGAEYAPLVWTPGDVAEEEILACAKYAMCAEHCDAITTKASSLEEAIEKLQAVNMLTAFNNKDTRYIAVAHYTDNNGSTTYAFNYHRFDVNQGGAIRTAKANYGYQA